jgi:phospholipase A-2-activating protein
MPNGDIVTGASDGVVRIFSEAEERWASPQDLKVFDDLVASQALPAQQVGDVKKSDLPGPEALTIPGMDFFVSHVHRHLNLIQVASRGMSK